MAGFDPISIIGGGITSAVGKVLDHFFPDPVERAKAEIAVRQLDMQGDAQQVAVNLKEAENPNLFVSGWRPSVGWICAGALLFHYILMPFLTWTVITMGFASSAPRLDLEDLIAILGGMLGLSSLRTFEKLKGAA